MVLPSQVIVASVDQRGGRCGVQVDVIEGWIHIEGKAAAEDELAIHIRIPGEAKPRLKVAVALRDAREGGLGEREGGAPERIRAGLLGNGLVVQEIDGLLEEFPA